jgi:nicotinamidase/pyrazinamidase
VFQKGTNKEVDSYSGFFDNDRRSATGLGDYLKQKGVIDVYVVGLATDYCVKHTALDAQRLGYRTHVIVDACRGVDLKWGDSDKALANMRKFGIKTLKSTEM